jgi:hypothetical protein
MKGMGNSTVTERAHHNRGGISAKVKKHCVHRFVSTKNKGKWTVKVLPINNRGKERDEIVTTTVFRCTVCGVFTEYPDSWDKNFVPP